MKRKRGTVIIETEKGILLTKDGEKGYLLPGGQLEKGETPFEAAIRELREETGLKAHFAKFLFEYESKSNFHTVILVKAEGIPTPLDEVKELTHYTENVIISPATKNIIERYLKEYQVK